MAQVDYEVLKVENRELRRRAMAAEGDKQGVKWI